MERNEKAATGAPSLNKSEYISAMQRDQPGYSDVLQSWRLGFDSRQEKEIFLCATPSRLALGPTQLISNGYRKLSHRGWKTSWRGYWLSIRTTLTLHIRTQLIMKLLSWTQSAITDLNEMSSDFSMSHYWRELHTESLAFDDIIYERVARTHKNTYTHRRVLYSASDAGSTSTEISIRSHILNDHRCDNLESLSLLKMESTRSSETSINIYQTTRRNITDNSNVRTTWLLHNIILTENVQP